jgi:predicted ArsR family transcriptional regulator
MESLEPRWRAALRRLIVHRLTEHGPQTTRELANGCNVSQDAIAPRMTELEAAGEIVDTGYRRRSVSGRGRTLKVWAIAG